MRKTPYPEKEIEILNAHYREQGAAFCGRLMNRSAAFVRQMASKMKVKRKEGFAWSKIPISDLIDITTPEGVYLLGLIWADGCVAKPGKGGHRVSIGLVIKDFAEIKPLLKGWPVTERIYRTSPNPNHQRFFNAQVSHKLLQDFLVENDYHIKSQTTPNKILQIIPDNLKNYFFRGWIDGDGNITSLDKSRAKMMISGTKNQDWGVLIDICRKLKTDYFVCKSYAKVTGFGGSDFCFLGGERAVRLILNWIYSGQNIGLSRKYNSYRAFIKSRNHRMLARKIKPMGVNSSRGGVFYGAYRTGADMKYFYTGKFSSKKEAGEAYDKIMYHNHKNLTRLNYPENYKSDPEYDKMGFGLFLND